MAGRQAAPSERRRPVSREMAQVPPSDDSALSAELQAARAENEMLLQQITRLCLYVESTSGADPIEIMHGRVPPVAKLSPSQDSSVKAASSAHASGWFSGILARVPGLSSTPSEVGDGHSGSRRRAAGPAFPPSGFDVDDANSMADDGRSEASFAGTDGSSSQPWGPRPHSSYAGSAFGGGDAALGGGGGGVGVGGRSVRSGLRAAGASSALGAAADSPPFSPPLEGGVEGVAGGSFEWRGDPEAIGELERKLAQSRYVSECVLDGVGLTRLPSEPSMWAHLGRTLSVLSSTRTASSSCRAPSEDCSSSASCASRATCCASCRRVLELKRLEELSCGCNQLTGLPEGIASLSSLVELYLVSNEISYLPQSIGALRRLRKLELSANALHELPRSIGKLTSLTHLWLGENALSSFPQHLCALDSLELLDVHANQLSTIPRAVGTMPQLKTLLLQNNPLSFPPTGVVAQGPAFVLDYVRRHRDAIARDDREERSLRQVAAYRDKLSLSIDAQEESLRAQQGIARGGSRGEAAPRHQRRATAPRAAAGQRQRRRRRRRRQQRPPLECRTRRANFPRCHLIGWLPLPLLLLLRGPHRWRSSIPSRRMVRWWRMRRPKGTPQPASSRLTMACCTTTETTRPQRRPVRRSLTRWTTSLGQGARPHRGTRRRAVTPRVRMPLDPPLQRHRHAHDARATRASLTDAAPVGRGGVVAGG